VNATPTPPASQPDQGPVDPRPAWERVAAAWLAREVDAGQPVDAATLARETSVTPATVAATLTALRVARAADPGLARVRMLLARDRIQAAYLAHQLCGGLPPDPTSLAREVGVSVTVARQWLRTFRAAGAADPALSSLRDEVAEHGAATPEQLAALRAHFQAGGAQARTVGQPRRDPPAGSDRDHSVRARLTARFTQVEADGHKRLDAGELARALGCSEKYAKDVLGQLRTAYRDRQLAAARAARARLPVVDPEPPPGWMAEAACAGLDTNLFFPGRDAKADQAAAKAVCAGCPVRDACLDEALYGPQAASDDAGVFGGTTPADRQRLRIATRGRRLRQPTRYYTDPAAAREAKALADRVGITAAAAELGVAAQALRNAFARYDLGAVTPAGRGGKPPTRVWQDRALAEQTLAHATAASIGAAARAAGVSPGALKNAWRHHGLDPPSGPPTARATRRPPLAPVFVALNPGLVARLARRGRRGELAERVRRAEQEATLGYRVTVELTAENHWPRVSARAWAVSERARHAHQRAWERHATERSRAAGERQPADRDGGAER
jgi:WhiB family redox-sensing transcriptional regulator